MTGLAITQGTSGLSVRTRTALSFAALVLPVLAGLAWMTAAGAPSRLVITNSAALILALVVAAFPARVLYSPWVAIACASAVVMTAIGGIEIEGVRRWFALGPLHLHTAMLVLPLFVATLPLLPVVQRTVALASVLIATVIQPDLAATLALTGAIVLAPADGQKKIGLVTGGFALLAAFMLDGPQPAPVAFVEGVLNQAWAASKAWFAIVLAGQFALLAIAFSAPRKGGRLPVSGQGVPLHR